MEVTTMSEDEFRDFLNGKRGEKLENVTVELPMSNEYGQIVKSEGKKEILLGDCLELMKDIPNGSIDCVVTDPPYKVTSAGNVPTGFINGHWRLKNGEANPQAKSGKIFKENEIKFSDWMPEIYRVLKEQTHFYCMTNDLHLKTVIEEGIKAGFKQQNILVWAKGMHTPTQYYFKNIEFIVMFRKGKAKYINKIGTMALIDIKGIRNKEHPSEKPVDLFSLLVTNSTKENEIVLDPFGGTGTIIESCLKNNRQFIAIEKDPNHFEKMKKRGDFNKKFEPQTLFGNEM